MSDTGREVSKSPPPDGRQSYSVLETGEVVAVTVERRGRNYNVWLWSDQRKEWFVPEGALVNRLKAGVDRYEAVLQKDPARAADLRMRSDNTVDNKNREPVKPKEGAGLATAEEPKLEEPGPMFGEEPKEERDDRGVLTTREYGGILT